MAAPRFLNALHEYSFFDPVSYSSQTLFVFNFFLEFETKGIETQVSDLRPSWLSYLANGYVEILGSV